jgi:hypothetical protein
MDGVQVKSEPVCEPISGRNQSMDSSVQEEPQDEDDPIVKEIDVYLSRRLSNNIFVLQVNCVFDLFFEFP